MLKLYGYWRSSAAFRLRIAMNLKGVAYEHIAVNIAPAISEQKSEAYAALNPQMRVPLVETGKGLLSQSMAILEWLEDTYPDVPILPKDAFQRAKCRAFADVIACDVHPLNNLSVLMALKQDFAADQKQIAHWYADWIQRGFVALEEIAAQRNSIFLFGDHPTLAEICLIPQMWNARRFQVELSAFPNLIFVDAACNELQPFHAAAPEQQPGAT